MQNELKTRKRPPVVRAVFVAGGFLLVAWIGVLYREVRLQSYKDETRPADVIVVFGAAEYAGHPSPVFRARLDHAYTLFQKGIAPLVIATGGKGGEPSLSEGGVGRAYLISRGIPENNIIAETQSGDTSQSAVRVANIMKANGFRTCVAVSDGYHIFRIKHMFAREGITAYGAPRPEYKTGPARQRFQLTMHEVLGYIMWKIHLD